MRARPRLGYLLLVPAAIVALGTLPWALGTRSAASPLVRYRPCREIVLGREWICANGHAWVRQGGGWLDVGGASPLAVVPRR